METQCDLDFGRRALMSPSRAELYAMNDAEVPMLSITAPSEEVSEVEDNLGSSASQTPSREVQSDEAREEAQRIVGDVLTQASEILQSQTDSSCVVTVIENSLDVEIFSPSEDNVQETKWSDDEDLDDTREVEMEKEKLKIDPEIRSVANEFVKRLIEEALQEANRRLTESKEKQIRRGSRDSLPERYEIVETSSEGCVDKRRPWYRRARTSARKLLHRLCVCGRAHRTQPGDLMAPQEDLGNEDVRRD